MNTTESKLIFAIDAGSTHSGYAIIESKGQLHRDFFLPTFGKVENEELLGIIRNWAPHCVFPIEFPYPKNNVVAYEVFLMTAWVGRMQQVILDAGANHYKIFRHREKSVMCHTGAATDSQIRAAIIDLYGGKGTKSSPGPTFGVSADVWQAIAVATTFAVEGDSTMLVKPQPKPKPTKPKMKI
ncbi:MAG: hypothetical protein WCL08_00200 [Verrucomicrobiota bacterium]